MNKDDFIKEISKNIDGASMAELKAIVMEICQDIPMRNYYKTLCRIRNIENNDKILIDDINEEVDEVCNDFKKVQNGEIVFKCYAVETGHYSAFGEDYDYYYYPTNEMDSILNRMYDLIRKLVFSKAYMESLKIIDLMLYSDYTCEEISNPEYSDDDDVIDTFDMNINSLKENLDFDINTVILYAIYAVIMSNTSDKFEKIDCYIKNKHIDIRDCQNLGIEEVPDIDLVYNDWIKYKNKSATLTN